MSKPSQYCFSIYRKYDQKVAQKEGVFDNIFFNDLGCVSKYNKIYDNILMKWLEEVVDSIKLNSILTLKEKSFLKCTTIRATKEILYNQIRKQWNFVDYSMLQFMCCVALIASYKIIIGMDWDCYPINKWMHYLSCGINDMKTLLKGEFYIFTSTDWNPCPKVYNRHLDI